jgi:hypothetical protein
MATAEALSSVDKRLLCSHGSVTHAGANLATGRLHYNLKRSNSEGSAASNLKDPFSPRIRHAPTHPQVHPQAWLPAGLGIGIASSACVPQLFQPSVASSHAQRRKPLINCP